MSVKIYPTTNWLETADFVNYLSKMIDVDKNIQLTSDYTKADYFVVFNKPYNKQTEDIIDKSRTILFRMEPNMEINGHLWGEYWKTPPSQDFLRIHDYPKDMNMFEWHLNKTFDELKTPFGDDVKTKGDVLSFIVSGKYFDPGHISRINFFKRLQNEYPEVDTHVYGTNRFEFKNFKGPLTNHSKDDGLIPYKYTFNVENNSIPGFITEKLWDGIMSETLVFYSGCVSVKAYVNKDAFVYLEMDDEKHDMEVIAKMIANNEWEKRIDIIRKEKHRLLNTYGISARLSSIINK